MQCFTIIQSQGQCQKLKVIALKMADFQQESFEVDIFELVRPNQVAIQSFNKLNA